MAHVRWLGFSVPVWLARTAAVVCVLALAITFAAVLWYPGYRAERLAEGDAAKIEAVIERDDRFRGVRVSAARGEVTVVCPEAFYNTAYNPSVTLGLMASLQRAVDATEPAVPVLYMKEIDDLNDALGLPGRPSPIDAYQDDLDAVRRHADEFAWVFAFGVYYNGFDKDAKGQALRSALHELISVGDVVSYAQLWEALAYTDMDPLQTNHVLLFYSGWSRPANAYGGRPHEWNREHVWAKSRGRFGNDPPMGTDLHHIRPTDVSVNQARDNRAFDDGGELYVDADGETGCRFDDDSWEPRDEVKGDVARMLFYMAVRYEDAALDLELVDEAPGQGDGRPVHGVLPTLLRWHAQDPPDDLERLRHARVYLLQGNRNPFIDHPEWVAVIWGE